VNPNICHQSVFAADVHFAPSKLNADSAAPATFHRETSPLGAVKVARRGSRLARLIDDF
jgi:hypothetical protein